MKLDLHVHTTRSDGLLTPGELCALSKKLGVVAVPTDHDVTWDYSQVCDFSVKRLFGMEVTGGGAVIDPIAKEIISPAHYNVFCPFPFTKDEVNKHSDVAGYVPQYAVSEFAKENGCIVQHNHPFFWFYKVSPLKWLRVLELTFPHVHIVETFNALETRISSLLSLAAFKLTASRSASVPIESANSDSHFPSGYFMSYNCIPDEIENFEDFKEAVEKGLLRPCSRRKAPLCSKVAMSYIWFGRRPPAERIMKPLKKLCGVNESMVEWGKVVREATGD